MYFKLCFCITAVFTYRTNIPPISGKKCWYRTDIRPISDNWYLFNVGFCISVLYQISDIRFMILDRYSTVILSNRRMGINGIESCFVFLGWKYQSIIVNGKMYFLHHCYFSHISASVLYQISDIRFLFLSNIQHRWS